MRHSIAAALAVVALLALPLPAATESAKPDVSTDNSETYRQLDLFGDVFERVRADYVEEVTRREADRGGDQRHAEPSRPAFELYRRQGLSRHAGADPGEFGGLGIEVTMENGLVKVVSPIDDTPAAAAGIKPGDFITHIDGEPVLGLTLDEAVDKMRGPVGTEIKLTVAPRRTAIRFDVTLDARHHQDPVGALAHRRRCRLCPHHQLQRADRCRPRSRRSRAARSELGKRWKGFVLDLRNNPGGLLDQAIAVSDAFLDKGEIVSTRGRNPDDGAALQRQAGRSRRRPAAWSC